MYVVVYSLDPRVIMRKYLAIGEYSDEAQRMIINFYILSGLMQAAFLISSAFYVIFVIDLVGFAQYGVLVAFSLILQALIDFPTSVVSDWLGYRFVLGIAYIGHAVSFFLLSFVAVVPGGAVYTYLFLVFGTRSFAMAQESGAFQSWFDTNYRAISDTVDPNRTKYRTIFGKTIILIRFLGSFAVLFGGRLSHYVYREFVFFIQALFMVGIAFYFIFFFKENIELEDHLIVLPKYKTSFKTFIGLLFSGFVLIFKSRLILLFVISFIIISTVNILWLSFFFVPINFAYTGTDLTASALYFAIFFSGSISTFVGVEITSKIRVNKWLPFVVLAHAFVSYGLFAVILTYYPVDFNVSNANFWAAFLFFIVSVLSLVLSTIWTVASQRILIDIVPDSNRTSFYSIMPTLSLIASSFMAYTIGPFLEVTDNLVATIITFLVLPTAGAGVLLFIALYDYSESDQVPDPLVDFIASEESLGSGTAMYVPKYWRIEPIVNRVWARLMKVAMEDGDINDDEKALLRQIMNDVKIYALLLEDALSDRKITQDEKEMLQQARDSVLQNAYTIANRNGDINKEEKRILTRLNEIIRDFIKIEQGLKWKKITDLMPDE